MNETAKTKQNKHETLDSAIDNVQSVLHSLEVLYEKIMNIAPEDKPCNEKITPSLNSVLDTGADRLYKTTEEIHVTINKIEDVIF